jgi:hypothetical protein
VRFGQGVRSGRPVDKAALAAELAKLEGKERK